MKKLVFALFILASALGLYVKAGGIRSLQFIAPQVYGKSNVYDPVVGEIIYDSSDSIFYGYTQASTWEALSGSPGSSLPSGVVLPFGGTAAPTGFLIADGSAVSRTTYAALFAVIGTAFGAGDGSTTFNLPDMRGRFMRGVDGSAGLDPDKISRTAMASGGNTGNNVGSVQADAFQGHILTVVAGGTGVFYGGSGINWPGFASATNTNTSPLIAQNPSSDGTHGTPRVSSETRSVNANFNYIIKI